jgi:hypothetical protein
VPHLHGGEVAHAARRRRRRECLRPRVTSLHAVHVHGTGGGGLPREELRQRQRQPARTCVGRGGTIMLQR